jgi:malate dehydrogenase (oxaloacetate-decarboxylating)(NADP+)
MENLKENALMYHENPTNGKIEVVPTKSCQTQQDLSLAYTPGVAQVCNQIVESPNDIYKYTAKGNLVAVISNGTAVLGLGNIGAAASKPVMEGKGILFKRFADVDVFDLEVNETDPDKLIELVSKLEPTFGGINLEDIKGPECFYIEEKLKEIMNIPVFHDDQHGTAIISGAAFINALEIVGKNIEDVKVVFSGGGAAGIACAKFYLLLGVKHENVIMCDSRGVIFEGRTDGMSSYKKEFAAKTEARSLEDALKGADVFVGVSVANILSDEMVNSMSADPIIFALANPDPEIPYDKAVKIREDVIMATGRSDFPNQVNNVLGFPFIFRGALDVNATEVNDEMKKAAANALAKLAKEPVIDEVKAAYGGSDLSFGKEYLIPKPFDRRVFIEVSAAVAESAVKTGVARIDNFSVDTYKKELEERYQKSISRFL